MEETTPKETLSSLPTNWPGAWGIYKYSEQAVRLNLSTILTLWVFILGLGIVDSIKFTHTLTVNVIIWIIFELLSIWISLVLIFVYLASIRGKETATGEALRKISPMLFLNYIVMSIVVGFLTTVSFIFFIIPFFFVAPRLSLASYFLLDKKLGPIEAIQASWDATEGNVGKVYGIIGATIAMMLLFITILCIPFAIYFLFMYQASMVVLYGFVSKKA